MNTIIELKKLVKLYLNDNDLTNLPKHFIKLESLEILNLNSNFLESDSLKIIGSERQNTKFTVWVWSSISTFAGKRKR